jgi:hypothetical protein
MTIENDDLIQRGLDAGIGAEEVKLWKHGAEERVAAEAKLVDKLYTLTERMDSFERGLADNTAATQQIQANTAAMVEVFESWRGAMRVLEWIGKAAKPVSYIAATITAIVAMFYAIKGGVKP